MPAPGGGSSWRSGPFFCRLFSAIKAAEGKRKPPVPELGRKAVSLRGTTQIRALRHALKAPVTEGGPAVSPRRLPGEPNGAARTGSQPTASPLCGLRYPLFSRSSLISNTIYTIKGWEMQEENPHSAGVWRNGERLSLRLCRGLVQWTPRRRGYPPRRRSTRRSATSPGQGRGPRRPPLSGSSARRRRRQ